MEFKEFEKLFPNMIKDESALEALGASCDEIQDSIIKHCLDKSEVRYRIKAEIRKYYDRMDKEIFESILLGKLGLLEEN